MKKIIQASLGTLLCAAMAAGLSFTAPDISRTAFAEPAVTAAAPAAAPAQKTLTGLTNVKKRLTISCDTVIPKGAVLYVRKGGALYINKGAKLIVEGKIKCADGGSIYSRGDIVSCDGSAMAISGKIKLMSGSSLSLGGTLRVNEKGVVKGSGTLEVLDQFSDITCLGTVSAKIKAPAPVTENGVTTVGGVILVNKEYDLPEDYGDGLTRDTYAAFLKMKEASGYDMTIVSGFRSYEKQQGVFDYWVSIDGYDRARTYSALPGQSEHQTGLAMDITSLSQSYEDTPEGQWLAENCWKYGFIIRYPKGKTDVTGYIYEPWHVRYLGKSMAKLVHDSGLTLEEFFGVYKG